MKNKRKILFAIIVLVILILGVTITIKLNKEGILFGKKSTSLSALDTQNASIGEEVSSGNNTILIGDANGDGKVDLNDATLIQRYLAKTITESQINLIAANVNKDSVVNFLDIKQIREYVRGNESEYLGSVLYQDSQGIMWLFDKVKKGGTYYAENLTYVSGYKQGDLVIPESFLSNYNYKTVSMTDVAFSECASKVERIIIPSGVTTINQDLFEGCSALKSVIFLQKGGTLALTDDMFSDANNNLLVRYYHGVTISDSYTGAKQESPYIYSITCDQNYTEDTGNLITVTVKFTAKTSGEYIPYLKMKVGDTNLQLYSKEMNTNRDEITYKYYKNPGLSGEILIEGFEYSSLKDDETGYFYIDMDTSKIRLNQSIDTESILINKVSIESNNAISSNRAKVGDTITLTFNSTEEIYNYGDFIVEIGGITNKDSRGLLNMQHPQLTTYTASLLITEDIVNDLLKDQSGNILIRIKDYQDQSGNVGAIINSTTPDAKGNCSYVKIDTTNPSIVKMEATGYQQEEGGSYARKTVLKAGDEVEIVIQSSEVLYDNKDYPVLGIKWGTGEEILLEAERMSTGGVGENYTTYLYYAYTIKEGDNGNLAFVSLNGDIIDLTGNVTNFAITNFSDQKIYNTNNVKADTVNPYITGINITLGKDDEYLTKTGEDNQKIFYARELNLTIDVKFSELANNPNNKIPMLNGVRGEDITGQNDTYSTIRYKMHIDNSGKFIINLSDESGKRSLYDIAGNQASLDVSQIEYLVNGTKATIIIDNVTPIINFKNVSIVNGGIYTKYCDIISTDNLEIIDDLDVTITLKDANGEVIEHYEAIKYSELTSIELQDGGYFIKAVDELGNMTEVYFTIDSTNPEIKLNYNKATDGHVTHVTVNPDVDANIDVAHVKLFNESGTQIPYNYLFDNIIEEGTYKIVATDFAGNVTEKYFKIDHDDLEVENVQITYSDVIDGKVTATISSTEKLQELEGWTLSEDRMHLTKEYATNTIETVTVEDLCGNTKDVYVKIVNIEGPELTFERKTEYQYVTDEDEMIIMVHSDKLIKLDEFKVNGKDVTINQGTEYRNDYEVRINVDQDMPEGDITLNYTCTYDDKNEGTKSGSTITDIYTIDRTAPRLESFTVTGYNANGTEEKTELKAGDKVKFIVNFDESIKLVEDPELKIKFGNNGEEITLTPDSQVEGYMDSLTYTYIVKQEDEGQLKVTSLRIMIKDIARNEAEILKSNVLYNIVADNTAPYITSITTRALNTGDVNGDGIIDETDATDIQNYIADIATQGFNVALADIDGDGKVTISDVLKLKSCLSPDYADRIGGIYTTGDNTYLGIQKKIEIDVNLSETVVGENIPTLTIKIGEGNNITLNNGVLEGKKITYSYMTAKDNGKVTIISLNNNQLTDKAGNRLNNAIPETDTKTYVDTELSSITANLAAGDTKVIRKNGLIYLKDFITSINIEDLSGIKNYTLKYQDQVISGYQLTHVIAKDGEWTLEVRDNVENTASYYFIIDTTPPVIKLNGKDENNVESIDNIVIDIEDDNIDLDSGITLYKNGSKVEFHFATQTTIYEAGEYRIVATDKAGNVTEKQFIVQRKAPTVNMYLGETQEEYTQDTWTNQSVRIELNVEPNDDVKEIQYRTSESTSWRTVSNNKVVLSQTGEYNFEARTKYINDKYSVTTSVAKIKIDKVLPTNNALEVTLGENTELVQNQWYNGNVSITIPVGTDAHSGIKNLVYTINGNKSQTTSDLKKSLSSQGIYTIVYNNVDNAGNKSQEIIKEIKIDTEGPTITYLNDGDQKIQGKTNGELDYIEINDDEILEVTEFTYFNQYVKLRIEDAVSGINDSSLQLFKYDEEVKGYVEYTDTAIMRDGRYIVTVKDNMGYRVTKGFVVDTTSPNVLINGKYTEVTTDTIKNNYYNSDVEIDILETNTSLVVYKKGTNGNYTEEYPFLNQIHKVTQDGSYKLIATDFVGNVTTVYFIIDRTNPTVEVSPNTTNWTNEDVILQIKATDNESGIGSIVVNDTQITANNGVGSYSVTTNGSYMVVVTDNAGNQITQTITVNNIDKTLPGLAISGNPTTWTRGDVTFNISATDNESGIANVTVNGNKVTMNNGTGKYTVTENGNYTVIATDNAGNQKTETVIVTKIDNVSPIIYNIIKSTESQTDKVILTVTATDEMSGVAGYSWDNGQTWSSSNTYEVTKNGTYAVQVKDKVGNIAELSITISNIKEAEETYFRISNYATKEKENTKYVIGISTNTSMSLFKQYIQTNMEYSIVDKHGNTVGNDRIVASGMKIKVSDGREYVLVVKADLNSDGKADISDLSVMASYLVGKGTLNTTYLLAGDLNNDGNVDITDISILAGAITKNIKL